MKVQAQTVRGCLVSLCGVFVWVFASGVLASPVAPTSRPAKASVKRSAQGKTTAFTLHTRDGFALRARAELPAGAMAATLKRVIIFVHGSGPNGMDGDVTAVTKGKKKNLVFKTMSAAFVKKGFGVIRYNKRTFEVRAALIARKHGAKKLLASVIANPLNSLIEDTKAFVGYAKKTFPKAQIYLLGVSQGTYLVLQAANEDNRVKGVGLIGFYATPLFTTLTFVQVIHRPMHLIRPLDKNNDNKLDMKELQEGGTLGMQLGMQFSSLDVDNDGKISFLEIQGGNMFNFFRFQRKSIQNYNIQEAHRPTVVEILKKARFKVAFFQGMRDNQTPASHAIGVRFANQFVWKKKNLKFWFFPGLGHILDPRSSYMQLHYNRMDPKALKTMCVMLDKFFR